LAVSKSLLQASRTRLAVSKSLLQASRTRLAVSKSRSQGLARAGAQRALLEREGVEFDAKGAVKSPSTAGDLGQTRHAGLG
jgi:hypothetical protein